MPTMGKSAIPPPRGCTPATVINVVSRASVPRRRQSAIGLYKSRSKSANDFTPQCFALCIPPCRSHEERRRSWPCIAGRGLTKTAAAKGHRRRWHGMQRYSIWALARNAWRGHDDWAPAWRSPEPKPRYEVVIIGAGGHGLATAYYLAKEHGVRDVAVLEKGWLGGGNTGRNTTIIRSNYLWDESAFDLRPRGQAVGGLTQELNFNVMFSQRGVLNLAHTARPAGGQAAHHANRLNGIDSEFLSAEQIKRLEPLLNTSRGARYPILGASCSGAAAPRATTRSPGATPAPPMRSGVDIIQNCEVTGIRIRTAAGRGRRDQRRDPLRQARRGRRRALQRDRGHGRLPPADRELPAAGAGLGAGQAVRQHGDHLERGARLHQPVGQGRAGDRRRHRSVRLVQPARQPST